MLSTNSRALTVQSRIRNNWIKSEILQLFEQPFNDLLFQAQSVHREFFDPNVIQLSALLNIKEGGCPEDCAYCSKASVTKPK